MKSKLITLLLSIALIASGCGNTAPVENDNSSQPEVIDKSAMVQEDTIDSSELETIGDIEVEKELFDVIITVPVDFIGETTQEELDTSAAQYGYKAVKNTDGSATYTMTKSQHKEMLSDMVDEFKTELSELVGSEDYPTFTDIEADSNFTNFTVTTTSAELDMNESFVVMIFYMYGGMYGIFSGETPDNVSVTFINADTKEVISTTNSSDMAE